MSVFYLVNSACILPEPIGSSKGAPPVNLQDLLIWKQQRTNLFFEDLEKSASNVMVIVLLTFCDAAVNPLS